MKRSSSPAGRTPGEHFTSEQQFVTYRSGHWKSYHRRRDGRVFLVDLRVDPGEQRDVESGRTEVVARHRKRVEEIARALGATVRPKRPTVEDEERLHSLGYLE